MALAHGEPVAGIGCCSPGGPPAVWTPYFAVKKADETAGRIGGRGATLAVGPLPLGEGRVGIAADRAGAVFGFWEGPGLSWSVGRGSAPARLDLQTRDAFEAAIFYAKIFDWAQPPGGCTADYAPDHVLIQAAGHPVATLRGGGIETDPDPRVRPRWIVDYWVNTAKVVSNFVGVSLLEGVTCAALRRSTDDVSRLASTASWPEVHSCG
ncbi:VOC family protein [Streptomyces sp. NPDC048473]|uniref:VOC family protein n=1 Tax=unclassified Streptomyces TaxID=2593676 RepID=UPI003716FFF9